MVTKFAGLVILEESMGGRPRPMIAYLLNVIVFFVITLHSLLTVILHIS
jgi:hypothetical protein